MAKPKNMTPEEERESRKRQNASYYNANKEKHKAQVKEWHEANKEKEAERKKTSKRRARASIRALREAFAPASDPAPVLLTEIEAHTEILRAEAAEAQAKADEAAAKIAADLAKRKEIQDSCARRTAELKKKGVA